MNSTVKKQFTSFLNGFLWQSILLTLYVVWSFYEMLVPNFVSDIFLSFFFNVFFIPFLSFKQTNKVQFCFLYMVQTQTENKAAHLCNHWHKQPPHQRCVTWILAHCWTGRPVSAFWLPCSHPEIEFTPSQLQITLKTFPSLLSFLPISSFFK